MKKKNKNRRILYGYHNLRELSERALRNLDGAMDNAHDVAVMRYVLLQFTNWFKTDFKKRGPKLISSADKKDPHCAWVGEYIKVRSDALGKKPLYISLGDVMQHGRRAIDANLCHIFSTENPKNDWAYNFICGGSRSGGKKYRMEHYGCSLDPIDVLSKLSAFTEQPTGDADAFRDITNGMYDTFKAKNHDYGNSFSELFAECGMTYAYGHLSEKLKRVKSLMSDEAKVKDESMRDSLLDLANYAILTIIELDKTKK